jgi:hypothetical protein
MKKMNNFYEALYAIPDFNYFYVWQVKYFMCCLYSLMSLESLSKCDWAEEILHVIMHGVRRFHTLRDCLGCAVATKTFLHEGMSTFSSCKFFRLYSFYFTYFFWFPIFFRLCMQISWICLKVVLMFMSSTTVFQEFVICRLLILTLLWK